VGLSVFIGSEYEHETLANLADAVNMCQDYGIPVMAVTAVGQGAGEARRALPGVVLRICAELARTSSQDVLVRGTSERVANGCPVPVMMAAVPSARRSGEVFAFVYDGWRAGRSGSTWGGTCGRAAPGAGGQGVAGDRANDGADVEQAVAVFEGAKRTS